MKNLRWQIVIAIIALAAVAVLLLGESQVGESITDIIEPSNPGGVYVEALIGRPMRFNPLLDAHNQVDRDVDRLVFSRMIRFDSWGNPQPELAESFGVSVNGDIFNIQLRENAVWHDGMPVTTADVLFTIELMRNADTPVSPDVRAMWNSVEVVAFDALNLQFRLEEPFVPFMDYLAFGILPKHLMGNKSPQEIINDPINLLPIGSGPFQVVDLRTDDGVIMEVVLEAFEDYYMGKPNIEQVVFRYFDTTQDALEAYRQGEILGIGSVANEALDEVLAEENLNIYSVRIPEMTMLLLNLGENGPLYFNDVILRQALITGLNRPWMVHEVMDGQAVVAHSPIMSGSWAYFPEVNQYDYNPEEAIKLLRSGGYGLPTENSLVREKDGESLSFELVYPETERDTKLAEMVQAFWEEIGVEVTLVPVEPDALVRDYLETRNYEAALVTLRLYESPDPDPYPFWHQAMISFGQNYSQWDDRRASEYLERARVTPNHQERTRLYRNFQIHYSREVPAIPLFYKVYNYALDQQVVGVQIGPLYDPSDRFDRIYEWSLETGPVIEEPPQGEAAP